MEFTRLFSKITKDDVALAGGKGASLSEMTRVGMPVPPGFVILASAFEQFLTETHLTIEIDTILHTVDQQEMRTIDTASKKITALILNSAIPQNIGVAIMSAFKNLSVQCVAVRSSATSEDGKAATWAGQLESFLNTTEDKLLENVQKCWASLFTPRAIFYRIEKSLHNQPVSVAVVVQKMVESEFTGVAFSVHPVTQDRNQLIIEADIGFGEALVAGKITPDSYVVEKKSRRIIDRNIHITEKPILNDSQLLILSDLVVQIENHYGFPVDIEWAYEKNKFYIVQSRPITTLGNQNDSKNFKKDDYILSFWVQGVSVFVADIHLEVYRDLEVLYIIDRGMFKQYFTKKAYERALERGLAFYSDKNAFNRYREDLITHDELFKQFFETSIKDKQVLSREVVATFFEYTKKLCGDYAKMNFEFTDKAFSNQEQNPVIKHNLSQVAKLKDSVRTIMNMILFEDKGYSNQLFVILGKKYNLQPSVFNNLTQQEILNLFEGVSPIKSIVTKRKDAFVESYNLDRFYEGKEAENIIQTFREEIPHTEIIGGQTASRGIITGVVKIIPVDYGDLSRVNAEIEKMNQGDILVAETTAPELIVACKKAGAIITDMGGLMSHAAIVSREFRIPCIVGTKNASKILKDGDRVEVDAEQGIVRVIKRAAI